MTSTEKGLGRHSCRKAGWDRRERDRVRARSGCRVREGCQGVFKIQIKHAAGLKETEGLAHKGGHGMDEREGPGQHRAQNLKPPAIHIHWQGTYTHVHECLLFHDARDEEVQQR